MFDEALIRTVGLFEVVSADQAIEDLTDGQRQMVDILVEDPLHPIEQRERSLFRRPGREAAHPRAHALHTTEQMHGLPCRRWLHRAPPRWRRTGGA